MSQTNSESTTVVLVSGGNAGIGYAIVERLSKLPNHHILMGTRSMDKGEAALTKMGSPSNVSPLQLDMLDDQSLGQAYESIEQRFGKLDILIANAGTAGKDVVDSSQMRDLALHIYNTNVISTLIFTQKMLPLLEKSNLPKIIYVSSGLGSIHAGTKHALTLTMLPEFPLLMYSASKAAGNWLTMYYSLKFPTWKVNAICPGYRATGLNYAPLNADTDPALGAIRVAELVQEGADGVTGTYSDKDKTMPW